MDLDNPSDKDLYLLPWTCGAYLGDPGDAPPKFWHAWDCEGHLVMSCPAARRYMLQHAVQCANAMHAVQTR